MSSFFQMCCGEGEEETKFGAVVHPSNYDWDGNVQSSRETTKKIRQIENSVAKHGQQRKTHKDVHTCCRRSTIYAKPLSDTHVQDFVPPVYPKSETELTFLEMALHDNFLFMDLSKRERDSFIQAFQRDMASKGDYVIRQGDIGDYFYVLERGMVQFIDGDKVVGECTDGGSFGELALLYDCPRAVSCKVASDTASFWKVDQDTFRYTLAHLAENHCKSLKHLIRKIDIFKDLEEADVIRFVHAMTRVYWKAGDLIVKKGEEGKVFYIIDEGEVRIHDIGLGDSQFEDQILKAGESFGERSLLTGEPRAANVTALSDVTTYAMDRETFEECIGPLKCRLERELRRQFVKSIPLFANGNLTSQEIEQLVTLMTEVCYRKGERLAEAGKPYEANLWAIRHGTLLVTSAKDSDKLYKLCSGDYFGDKSVVAEPGRISSHNAVCAEPLTTWLLTREGIESVIGDISRLGNTPNYKRTTREKTIVLSDLKKHSILGAGAFGKVWLVSLADNDKEAFAMKMISKRKVIDSKQVKSVMREKEFLGLLKHPFILHMISSFQDEFNLYLLLPIIPGGELFSLLQKSKTSKRGLPSVYDAAFYGACILEALSHFHTWPIAYRDLKLENALIDKDGYAVIVDLGFAKIVSDKTYTLVGTPEYLAPEVIMSKGHNHAVDYWALGVLLYELLVGQSPFYQRGSSQMEMFKRIVLVKYSCPECVPEDAQDIIEKLLVRRQSNRLGNLANGSRDVKGHEWFKSAGIDFKKVIKKEAEAPWVPELTNPFDAAENFDSYRSLEKEVDRSKRLTEDEQELFIGF